MITFRRRLVFWLIKEYARKWKKTIFFFFILGLLGFFLFWTFITRVPNVNPVVHHKKIGIVGAYSTDFLPTIVLQKISRGLTKIDQHGKIAPDIASSWQIKDGGKTYVFAIKPGLFFQNGTPVVSENIDYNFSDAKVERPNSQIIVFRLRDPYAPFLLTVSQPILRKGSVGIGDYKVKNVQLNGNFIRSLTLQSIKNHIDTEEYKFYPTADSVKIAFLLGEVTQAERLHDEDFRNTKFSSFQNATVVKTTDYQQLVTLFFNTQDTYLSSRDTRTGLMYAIPDVFPQGERAYTLYPPTMWSYSPEYNYAQDAEHARLLTSDLKTASKSATIILDIKTLPKYIDVAEKIARAWSTIGVESIVESVDAPPSEFQVFLGDFSMPNDPDQYPLWHSGQENNITKYENKRIDKLLEDGRKTLDLSERKKIYGDLQKYLLADTPAVFLYFPYEYTITRK